MYVYMSTVSRRRQELRNVFVLSLRFHRPLHWPNTSYYQLNDTRGGILNRVIITSGRKYNKRSRFNGEEYRKSQRSKFNS